MSDRRNIYDVFRQLIRLHIDWTDAHYYDYDPHSTTVMLYNSHGETISLWTNETEETLSLALDDYKVIAHNEHNAGFSSNSIQIINSGAYSSYEAQWKKELLRAEFVRSDATTSYAVVNSADHLYSHTDEALAVTPADVFGEVVNDYYIIPIRVTKPVTMKVLLSGIDYTASSGSYAYIDGMAEGYKFATGPSTTSVTHLNYLISRAYASDETLQALDPDNYDPSASYKGFGTMDVASHNVFGLTTTSVNPTVTVRIRIRLRGEYGTDIDGNDIPIADWNPYILLDQLDIYQRVFTKVPVQINVDDNGRESYHISIGALEGEHSEDADCLIEIPFAPDDGGGSGFDVEVGDWGDEVVIPMRPGGV